MNRQKKIKRTCFKLDKKRNPKGGRSGILTEIDHKDGSHESFWIVKK